MCPKILALITKQIYYNFLVSLLKILVIPYFNNLFSNQRKLFRDQCKFFFSVRSAEKKRVQNIIFL